MNIQILDHTQVLAINGWLLDRVHTSRREWPYLDPGGAEPQFEGFADELKHPDCLVTVAYDEDKIAGFSIEVPATVSTVCQLPYISSIPGRLGSSINKSYWSHWFYVDPYYRGANLGAQIMPATIAELKSRGAELWVFNILNRRLPDPRAPEGYRNDASYYEKHGFKRAMVPPVFENWIDIGDDKPSKKFYFTYYMDLRQ